MIIAGFAQEFAAGVQHRLDIFVPDFGRFFDAPDKGFVLMANGFQHEANFDCHYSILLIKNALSWSLFCRQALVGVIYNFSYPGQALFDHRAALTLALDAEYAVVATID